MRIHSAQQNYCDQTFGVQHPVLELVRAQMQSAGVDFKSVSPSEARILQFLIRAFQLERILELGTLYGYSALAMAQVLPPSGLVVTVEKDPEIHRQARQNFAESPWAPRLDAICGDARTVLPSLVERGPFDLVWIDANKGAYADYLTWAESNVRVGGLIVGDNTFLKGGVWGESESPRTSAAQVAAMREFNLRLAESSCFNAMVIPTQEGLTVAQKIK